MSRQCEKICLDHCFMVDTSRQPARSSLRSGSNARGCHGRL